MKTSQKCSSRPTSRIACVAFTMLFCIAFYFLVTVDYILDSEDAYHTHFLGAVAVSMIRVLPVTLAAMYFYLFSEGVFFEFLRGRQGSVGRSLISIMASVSVLAIASALFVPWALIVLYLVDGPLH